MPERIDEPTEVAEHVSPPEETLAARPYRQHTDRVQTSAQVIVAVAVVLAGCYVAKLVLVVLLFSVLIAFMLAPVVDGLQKIRLPRSVAAAIALLLLLAIFYGMSVLFYNRAVAFVHDLPKYSERIRQEVGKLQKEVQKIRHTTETILPQEPQSRVQLRSESWTSALTQGASKVWDVALILSFVRFLV